ncbi:MAG: tRNA (adenosine(37)-N6)-dimethylallyltransferase MiaA [Pseudomonadota bacterium]
MKKQIIIIYGATASGKSALALEMAKKQESVIINADSMQIYKEIPIITAQPTQEQQNAATHKLYGIISLFGNGQNNIYDNKQESFSVAKWLDLVKEIIDESLNKNITPIIVGGTAMYLNSLIYGITPMPDIETNIRAQVRNYAHENGNEILYNKLIKHDPNIAKNININDTQRIIRSYEILEQTGQSILYWQEQPKRILYPHDSFELHFLNPDREIIYQRCNERFIEMIKNNVIEEVNNIYLQSKQYNITLPKAVGIKEIILYLEEKISLEEAIKLSQTATRQYAKRQLTWFRKL